MKKVIFLSCSKVSLSFLSNLSKSLGIKVQKVRFPKDISRSPFSVVFFDSTCFKKFPKIRLSSYADKIFILLVDNESSPWIKKVFQLGFFDYLTKNTSPQEGKLKIKRALKFVELQKENQELKEKIDSIRRRDFDLDCFNYKYFTEYTTLLIKKNKKKTPVSFIILDIDYFRQINETYGVCFADYILKELLNIIKKSVPKDTVITRYREDAFILIFPDCNLKEALRIANKLKKKISEHRFSYKDIETHISLSIGIVNTLEHKLYNYREVILGLEDALEKAKVEGGGRIQVYTSPASFGRTISEDREVDVEVLKRKIRNLTRQINQNMMDMIYGFAKAAIETQDLSTANHVEYVATLAKKTAEELGLSPQQVNDVYYAALLHDLGKIGVSSKILLKRSKLSKREREAVETHSWIGAEILREIHALKGAIPAILYHHERWDGTGYPLGLKGEEIPLGARIVAVADVYAALTSDRPYRKAYSKRKAIEMIKKEKGKAFDPRIVDIFLDLIKKEG